jgi:hypothetical protein
MSAMQMTKITTVEGIGQKYRELVDTLDVPSYYRTFHTTPQHDGSPHIEKEGDCFCFVVTERGQEFTRIRTADPDEILYLLLEGVTHVAATTYELKNRVEGIDGLEVWFPYQERLLGKLRTEWGVRKRQEHEKILLEHPFQKGAEQRRAW